MNSRITNLKLEAAALACLDVLLTIVWALSSRGHFWPFIAMLPLTTLLAIHGWFVLADAHAVNVSSRRGAASH